MLRSLQKFVHAPVMVLDGELFGEFCYMKTYYNTKKKL